MLLVATALCGCGATTRARPEPAIAFTRCCSTIFLLSSDGSTRVLTTGDLPKWSPNHRQIVFTKGDFSQRPKPTQEAWLMNADGTGMRQLTSVYPDQVRFVAFGGRIPEIAYADGDGIKIMHPDGSGLRTVIHDGGYDNQLAISPDGATIAYARNDAPGARVGLFTVGIHGTGKQELFSGTTHTCNIMSPSWSPDGRWIAFTLCVDKGGLNDEFGIWLVSPNGRGLHRIATNGSDPTWSPDGQWIAFIHSTENGAQNDERTALVKIHPDGSRIVRLTPYVSNSGNLGDSVPNW